MPGCFNRFTESDFIVLFWSGGGEGGIEGCHSAAHTGRAHTFPARPTLCHAPHLSTVQSFTKVFPHGLDSPLLGSDYNYSLGVERLFGGFGICATDATTAQLHAPSPRAS